MWVNVNFLTLSSTPIDKKNKKSCIMTPCDKLRFKFMVHTGAEGVVILHYDEPFTPLH